MPAPRTELSEREQELLREARQAAERAYAPYSRFRVGAALDTDSGVYRGCNVENASYGLCMCAERCAVFSAISAGATKVTIVAVSCLDAGPGSSPAERMPCGACRQVLSEFADESCIVVVDGAGAWNLADLLPLPFRLGAVTQKP